MPTKINTGHNKTLGSEKSQRGNVCVCGGLGCRTLIYQGKIFNSIEIDPSTVKYKLEWFCSLQLLTAYWALSLVITPKSDSYLCCLGGQMRDFLLTW